ncbi:MAG: cytochrome c3 family protein [Bacteriovoracaceae bacterium]|jgi:hypothetical protein|nr:cytochrome c3 family protein [Bacteriovoracaceae bacterium]
MKVFTLSALFISILFPVCHLQAANDKAEKCGNPSEAACDEVRTLDGHQWNLINRSNTGDEFWEDQTPNESGEKLIWGERASTVVFFDQANDNCNTVISYDDESGGSHQLDQRLPTAGDFKTAVKHSIQKALTDMVDYDYWTSTPAPEGYGPTMTMLFLGNPQPATEKPGYSYQYWKKGHNPHSQRCIVKKPYPAAYPREKIAHGIRFNHKKHIPATSGNCTACHNDQSNVAFIPDRKTCSNCHDVETSDCMMCHTDYDFYNPVRTKATVSDVQKSFLDRFKGIHFDSFSEDMPAMIPNPHDLSQAGSDKVSCKSCHIKIEASTRASDNNLPGQRHMSFRNISKHVDNKTSCKSCHQVSP